MIIKCRKGCARYAANKPVFKQAFTLVELLVVIGIIALLISLLLPALSKARDQANMVKCLSNLRTLGLAINMYTGDNKSVLPLPDLSGNGLSAVVQAQVNWYYAVDPYMTRQMKNFGSSPTATNSRNNTVSKQDPVWPLFSEDPSGSFVSKTYKMNSYLGGNWSGLTTARWGKISMIRRSAETVLMFDGISQDCCIVLSPTPPTDSFSTEIGGGEQDVGLRHSRNKSANVLFVDGHAANIQQAITRYTSGSGKNSFNTWYFEYAGTSAPARETATAKQPQQTLLWNVIWQGGTPYKAAS